MAAIELQALRRSELGELARLLPASRAELAVQLVEPLHVLSLRHLPGGAQALAAAAAMAGVASLPGPGRCHGQDPWLVWRSASEWLFVSTRAAAAEVVLQALPADTQALAVAIDQSAGSIAFALQGPALDALLHRLLDAEAVPGEPGLGSRARLADIAVVALRLAPQRAWLLADRGNDHYLAQWIAYASESLEATA
ncbi:MAG: hypothetical protein ACREO8_00455 [Luteimonas sp.]